MYNSASECSVKAAKEVQLVRVFIESRKWRVGVSDALGKCIGFQQGKTERAWPESEGRIEERR